MNNTVLELVTVSCAFLGILGVPFFKVVTLFTAVVLVLRIQGVL